MNYRVVGSNTVVFGTAGLVTGYGTIVSCKRKHGGDKLELKDEEGRVFCVIYFNDKDECEFTAIFKTDVTLPARGDALSIASLANCRLDDFDIEWQNEKERMLTIRATRYPGVTG
jgi:hypothetical protein